MEKEEKAKQLLAKYGEKPLYVKMELCQERKDRKEEANN